MCRPCHVYRQSEQFPHDPEITMYMYVGFHISEATWQLHTHMIECQQVSVRTGVSNVNSES